MNDFNIKSRVFGLVSFSCSGEGGYILCTIGNETFQICKNGQTMGNTVTCYKEQDFKRLCYNWYIGYKKDYHRCQE